VRVKGTLLKTRLDFVIERFGPDAPETVLSRLGDEDRQIARAALSGSWVPFTLLDRIDETIVRELGSGDLSLCREIGAFSARRNLATVYSMFVDQAQGDPQRLMEGLSSLHSTFYDWGGMRAVAAGTGLCQVEVDYGSGATRANCLTAVGFYAEALTRLGVRGAQVTEKACQASGAPVCVFEVAWSAA
jgi:hypothetical protein